MNQQPLNQPGMQTQVALVVPRSDGNEDRRHQNKSVLRGLGITEILIGSLSILIGVIAMIISPREVRNYINRQPRYDNYGNRQYYYHIFDDAGFNYSAAGVWCGILTIICGILGVVARRSPTRCIYISNMIMTIVTANICFAGAVLSGIAAGLAYYSNRLRGLHGFVTVLLFVVFVITIIHSAFCCRGACCSKPRIENYKYVANPQQHSVPLQPQYVQGPNGQVFMVSNQPMIGQVPVQSHHQMTSGVAPYPYAEAAPMYQNQSKQETSKMNYQDDGTSFGVTSRE